MAPDGQIRIIFSCNWPSASRKKVQYKIDWSISWIGVSCKCSKVV